MLALVPFRDAGVRARLYGVEIAKGLVAQARSEAAVHPARALALLDRAEDIAPSLSAIRVVRAEIGPLSGRRAGFRAPPIRSETPVITAINIALLVVVLAAVALVTVRRRRSGAGDEVVSEEESRGDSVTGRRAARPRMTKRPRSSP